MVKVYLATSGEYSDYRIQHVFARREDAEAYPLGDDVEERQVHDGPVEVRLWHVITWRADRPDEPASDVRLGNPYVMNYRRDFDGRPGHTEHDWAGPPERTGPVLNVGGWHGDRVRKVYSEQRAQYIAGKGDD